MRAEHKKSRVGSNDFSFLVFYIIFNFCVTEAFIFFYRQAILERVLDYPIRQRGFRVISTSMVTSCHREECFSLFHSTPLVNGRAQGSFVHTYIVEKY